MKTPHYSSKIYQLTLLLAAIIFIYIYGFNFDRFSEEELIRLTSIWVLLFVFGSYGWIIDRLAPGIASSQYKNRQKGRH